MDHAFSFNQVKLNLVPTTDEVLMNAARYQVRIIQSRAASGGNSQPQMENIARFSLILAHVNETTGLPFAVPDPLAHPETIGLVWDVYLTDNAALWDQLLSAIGVPASATKQIKDNLPKATHELDALSVHHRSPFKRKQSDKRGR